MSDDKKIARLRPVRPCPICLRPSVQQFHPFCSSRCADIDLNRWLSGRYVIPATEDEEEDEEPATEINEGDA
ncbi:MAG: DNA gyrase inhibitor YacG [Alphaproteobacteria bacterium]|nr:DNA gyrase inhibitor YacG [Alphaproteobacteria bacterium]